MDNPLAVASSSFSTITGMNWADLVTFVQYGVIRLYFGDFIAFVFTFRDWIITGAIIGFVFFFVGRWLRFFSY